MHFSRVVQGLENDLEIIFRDPWAIQWEEESFGLIDSPEKLPKCTGKHFSDWTHPTLIIEGSKWRDSYVNSRYDAMEARDSSVTHFFLVSMNDLLHVLAEPDPETKWVEPSD
jgi:hypothetical protein